VTKGKKMGGFLKTRACGRRFIDGGVPLTRKGNFGGPEIN